jgi:antitoxin FitA
MHMNTHIQIRNVPADLHRKLKIRAAQKDMTLTDFVKKLIENELSRPSLAELTERLQKLPPVVTSESAADIIRRDRDSR